MKKITCFLCAVIWITACQSENSGDRSKTQAFPASPEPATEEVPQSSDESSRSGETQEYSRQEGQQTAQSETPVFRQIIRTGHLRFQVKNVKESTGRIEAIVAGSGGYISSMEMTNSSYQITSNFLIRTPAARFDSLMNALTAESVFLNTRRVDAQDVTEEYLDIETRLKTKKEVRDRYVDILRNKARTVEEVLKAEEAIRVIQEEIEAREGRLKYLRDQVAMSSINLEIYEEVTFQPEPKTFKRSFAGRALSALRGGWDGIVGFLIVLINIWPLLLFGGLLIWQRKRIFRWKR